MKVYIEAYEIPEEEDIEADFARIDLAESGKTEEEAVKDLKELFSDKEHFIIQRHRCNHDVDPSIPCQIELIYDSKPPEETEEVIPPESL